MSNKILSLCLTGSLVLPTGTAAQAVQADIEQPPTTTGPIELPQSITVSPVAKPAAAERDSWTATSEKQLAAIRAAEAATAARAAAKEAKAKAAAERKAAKPKPNIQLAFKLLSAAGWRYPVSGRISSGFGWRPRPIPGVNPFHKGTDFAAPCGNRVNAAKGGRVIQAGWYGTYGNWILIQHADGIQTGYAHSSRILVRVGQVVKAGQQIATVGRTGAATGCHVHFEIRTNKGPINPVTFMGRYGGR